MNEGIKLFIGGTGRSGTTIMGSCLEEISDSMYFIEPGLIVGPYGIASVMDNSISLGDFCFNVKKRINKKTIHGLTNLPHCRNYKVDRFTYSSKQLDPLINYIWANRSHNSLFKFVRDYINIGMSTFNASHLIYKTPNLMCNIDLLLQIYPDMYFINVIREPKDIYESVITYKWGPKNVTEFIKWYYKHMSKALYQYIHISNNRYMVIQLEDLIRCPILTCSKILDKLGLDYTELSVSCAKHINIDNSNIGRYKNSTRIEEHKLIDEKCGDLYRMWLGIEGIKSNN